MTGISPPRLLSIAAFPVVLFAIFQGPAAAQIEYSPTKTTTETLPNTFHCGTREDLHMSTRDKACYWWTQSFNAPMITGAAFNAALDQWVKNSTNQEWGQGVEGFSRRFGTRVSQSMAKGTGQALGGLLFHEDPRMYASHKEGFGPRLGFALTRTFMTRVDCNPELATSCKERISVGRLGGAFASGFVGMAWTPDRINTPNRALVRSGTAMGGVMVGSLWKEFQPDLTRMLTGLLRPPPPKVPTPPSVKKQKAQAAKQAIAQQKKEQR